MIEEKLSKKSAIVNLKALQDAERDHPPLRRVVFKLSLEDFRWNAKTRTLVSKQRVYRIGPIPHVIEVTGKHQTVEFHNTQHDFPNNLTIFYPVDNNKLNLKLELRWDSK